MVDRHLKIRDICLLTLRYTPACTTGLRDKQLVQVCMDLCWQVKPQKGDQIWLVLSLLILPVSWA